MIVISNYFEFLNKYDPAQIAAVLESEKAQTVAVVLGSLSPDKSAAILKKLSQGLRSDVTKRLATSGKVPEAVIVIIESTLRKKLENVSPCEKTGL